ncbi:MAG: DsrE/DsrF/DrsH-like family protein [Clostridia bacterium]|nr:DsrE/DsrF/DrsH-like family protein [Clostridia bacterium]
MPKAACAFDISPASFFDLDFDSVTILDIRDPDAVLVNGIPGALNIPYRTLGDDFSSIPRDRPVYVICYGGVWSIDVTEKLRGAGYDAYNLAGGFEAWLKYVNDRPPVEIDAKGLRCPGPIVKTADAIKTLRNGERVRVQATEEAFSSDIRVWAQRTGNELISLDTVDGVITALIRKRGSGEPIREAGAAPDSAGNDKTFVVFSGDLDKTIAAFIIANGAASLGRKVTMFFTFWGLNILRKPEKVSVQKSLIERMFGFMMPRGTKKLGLSRMNMLGAGPRMIRGIMAQKGISSLEELIISARAHGVRLVACQMSMDVMGIRQEELIDGVELGGVATFIGSGETSDMSLFI